MPRPMSQQPQFGLKAVDWFGSGFLPLVAALLIGVVMRLSHWGIYSDPLSTKTQMTVAPQ
eukprot:2617417-Amphidinium_carterae.1